MKAAARHRDIVYTAAVNCRRGYLTWRVPATYWVTPWSHRRFASCTPLCFLLVVRQHLLLHQGPDPPALPHHYQFHKDLRGYRINLYHVNTSIIFVSQKLLTFMSTFRSVLGTSLILTLQQSQNRSSTTQNTIYQTSTEIFITPLMWYAMLSWTFRQWKSQLYSNMLW